MKQTDYPSILTPPRKKSEVPENKSQEKGVSKKIIWIIPIITLTMISFYLITEFQQSNYAVLSRVSTQAAETRSIILPDGSTVTLRPGSTLRYPKEFNGDSREVYLDGEAYFDIVKSERGFIVHGLSLNIKSNQAKFNYKEYAFQAALSLQLKSGELELISHRDRKKHYTLDEGHRLTFDSDQEKWEVEKADMERVGSSGYTWFDNSPLAEVTAYMDLLFNTETELSEGLGPCTIHFEGLVKDPQSFYKLIAKTLNLELKKDGAKFLLKGQACQS